MSSVSTLIAEKWETVANAKFLENKGQSFDGCDTVRLYDYLIYYEDVAIRRNIDEDKRIRWFVYHMKYGAYVYYRLKEDQKRTWSEFKQNLLEAYKQEEQTRMSWSVPRYSQPKHDVNFIKHELVSEADKNEKQVDCNSDARFIVRGNTHSNQRRRCYNCGSATHLLQNCRVPPATVRQRTNSHREKIGHNHQQRICSGEQNACEPQVHAKCQLQMFNQRRLQEVNGIYLEAKVGKDKTPICVILDSGSNCNVMSRRFYTTNMENLHLIRKADELATSFNGARSAVIGSVDTDISLVETSLPVSFKVIDGIKYDSILGLDFIKKNVESIDVKQHKLTLACGTVVPFCWRDVSSSGSLLECRPNVVNTLRVRQQLRPRRLPSNWRDRLFAAQPADVAPPPGRPQLARRAPERLMDEYLVSRAAEQERRHEN